MRRSLQFVLSLSAVCAIGCGGDYYNHGSGGGGGVVNNPCNPPTQSSYVATGVYDILPKVGFETDPSSSNPWYGITSDGAGTYHLEWSDPTGAVTCFTGLVTVAHAFATPPQAQDNTKAVLNTPEQLAFSGIPGSDTNAVDFYAGDDVINVEGYTDANADIDFYYTDNGTGAVSLTASNVAAFQSP